MPSDNGKRFVSVLLGPDHLQGLEEIRAFYGIKSRSDVIRLLIQGEVRRLDDPAPAVRDIVGAYKLGKITAEEALSAIGGHRDHLS